MRRRTFLSTLAGGAGAAVAAGLLPPTEGAARTFPDLEGSICRAASAVQTAEVVEPARGPLSFVGSRLLKDGCMEELAAAFTARTGRPMLVLGGGCDDGIAAVRTGRAHLGGLCCEPHAGTPTDGLRCLTIADDLKVVVCHPSVPVETLGRAEVRALVTGAIDNWKDLGGPARRIALVAYDHGHDYSEPVRNLLMDGRARYAPRALSAKTDQELLDLVQRFEWSAGVNSWVLAQPLVAAGKLKVLAVDGQHPAPAGTPSPAYPLRGPLSLALGPWQENLMRPFLDFLFGPDGQRLMARRLLPWNGERAGYA
ncbi:MAG TPA: hypothetical protein VD995_31055 [Azospirillum sp.]|nr:hypothetical protein [Azospirillum sp.]